jgi:hypothetical protein
VQAVLRSSAAKGLILGKCTVHDRECAAEPESLANRYVKVQNITLRHLRSDSHLADKLAGCKGLGWGHVCLSKLKKKLLFLARKYMITLKNGCR